MIFVYPIQIPGRHIMQMVFFFFIISPRSTDVGNAATIFVNPQRADANSIPWYKLLWTLQPCMKNTDPFYLK